MVKTKSICKCGHELYQHRADLKECYVNKHIADSHYQCTCKGFEEEDTNLAGDIPTEDKE